MLNANNSLLLVIDVQERLVEVMAGKEDLLKNLSSIIKGAKVLGMPVIYTEQNPEKLGATIIDIADLLDGAGYLSKMSFSCWDNETFRGMLEAENRSQVLVAGIESHVCVYQTARDLLLNGFEVHIIVDATASRARGNHETATNRIEREGATLTSTEMALFELVKVSGTERFREIIKLIR